MFPFSLRRLDPVPAAERPRRHRSHAPARGRDQRVRDLPRRMIDARMTELARPAITSADRSARRFLVTIRYKLRPHGTASRNDRRDRILVTICHKVRARDEPRAVLPGDGIGPEVTAQAVRVLDAFGIGYSEHAFGGNAILAQGTPLPDETLAACRGADAVLLAAVGLPELEGQPVRPEQGLLGLRKELGVYANLRPARARRNRHHDRPGARRRSLLRREGDPRGRNLVRHLRVLAPGGRADRTSWIRDRRGTRWASDVGRQGQRHAHVTAVARRRDADGASLYPPLRSTTHSSTRSR